MPISGDIAVKGLGIDSEIIERLKKEVNVVISCAASINFTDPLMTLLKINYFGPLQLLNLAKQMENIEVFCHVSTAYSNCHKPYFSTIPEEIIETGDPDEIVNNIMSKDPEFVQQNEKEFLGKWVNTYVYAKNMAERAIKKHSGDKFRTIIVRPSVVVATYKEPVPGYTDTVSAGGAMSFPMLMGLTKNFFLTSGGNVECCPGDVCSNSILVACCYAASTPKPEFTIINACTSNVHKMEYKEFFPSVAKNYLSYNPTHI